LKIAMSTPLVYCIYDMLVMCAASRFRMTKSA